MTNCGSPKKALLIYCPHEPKQPIPNVDSLTLKGCLGCLALEEEKETPDLLDSAILQILGLYDDQNSLQFKTIFNQRFNDMSIAIISNNKNTLDIANQLEFQSSNIESIEKIEELISKNAEDVVLIDFTNYHGSAWNFVESLLGSIMSKEKDNYAHMIQCVISPVTMDSISLPQLSTFIPPRQSHLIKNGKQVNINHQIMLKYAYYHAGSGRTDNTTRYNQDSGCGGNHKILAWHFLAEVGHKLGFVPKYGA